MIFILFAVKFVSCVSGDTFRGTICSEKMSSWSNSSLEFGFLFISFDGDGCLYKSFVLVSSSLVLILSEKSKKSCFCSISLHSNCGSIMFWFTTFTLFLTSTVKSTSSICLCISCLLSNSVFINSSFSSFSSRWTPNPILTFFSVFSVRFHNPWKSKKKRSNSSFTSLRNRTKNCIFST